MGQGEGKADAIARIPRTDLCGHRADGVSYAVGVQRRPLQGEAARRDVRAPALCVWRKERAIYLTRGPLSAPPCSVAARQGGWCVITDGGAKGDDCATAAAGRGRDPRGPLWVRACIYRGRCAGWSSSAIRWQARSVAGAQLGGGDRDVKALLCLVEDGRDGLEEAALADGRVGDGLGGDLNVAQLAKVKVALLFALIDGEAQLCDAPVEEGDRLLQLARRCVLLRRCLLGRPCGRGGLACRSGGGGGGGKRGGGRTRRLQLAVAACGYPAARSDGIIGAAGIVGVPKLFDPLQKLLRGARTARRG